MSTNLNDISGFQSDSQHVCGVIQNYAKACEKVNILYPVESTMNIPSWAALILTACLVCGEGKHSKHPNINKIKDSVFTKTNNDKDSDKPTDDLLGLKVGQSINVLPRYGSLAQSLKVLSSSFNDKWLFRERTFDIFEPNSYWANFGGSNKRGGSYDDHFLIDFCDSTKDLYSAYFDHFEIEGIPEAYKAFMSAISTKAKAQALGILPTYLNNDDTSYVLVRLFRRDTRALLDGDLQLKPEFVNASRGIRIGYDESARQFIDRFGSHVIVEYELGDVIYQIFVFDHRTYKELKTTFALSYEEAKRNFTAYNESPTDLLNIKKYFTPLFAMHVGQVKMASGNSAFESQKSKLDSSSRFRPYQSIFETLKEKEISKGLLTFRDKVITGMRLKKITKALSSTRQRFWLSDILDNTLSLYYTTL